jgi:hypothetical protein
MARRVFLHLGLPKTGTSYLQTILWSHRPQLRDAGLLVPGRERRDHLWASLVARDDPRVGRRNPRAPQAWQVLLEESAAFPGDVLISHEFFAAASADQAERVLRELEPAEVHLIVTSREPLGLFTSSWQESLKNKGTTPLAAYGGTESEDPLAVWDWRTLDLGLVLQRWAGTLTPDRVHVLVAPGRDAPADALWVALCAVLDIDPGTADPDVGFANSSMGVVEAELLRRLNGRLTGFDAAYDRGVWIRTFLADERLGPRGGERFAPGPEQIADCRVRGERAVALIRERGYDVRGDLESLLVPAELPRVRHPDSVTDTEIAEAALDLAARLMTDLREGAGPGAAQGLGPRDHPERGPWWSRLERRLRARPRRPT